MVALSATLNARGNKRWLRSVFGWAAAGVLALALLYLVWTIYAAGQPLLAVICLGAFGVTFYVYLSKTGYTWRYLFPGVAAMLVFVVFPLVYTVDIGFTNYSSRNLLTFERATQYFLDQTFEAEGGSYSFTLYPDGDEFRLLFIPKDEADEDLAAAIERLRASKQLFVTPPLALRRAAPPDVVNVVPLAEGSFEPKQPVELKEIIRHRDVLSKIRMRFPDGTTAVMSGLREFAPQQPLYQRSSDGTLANRQTGDVLTPNFDTGFYETKTGEQVRPGFKVDIGFGNYRRMIEDQEFRGPFIAIFLWTVMFAGLTVLFTLAVGCTLAVVLNWEAVRFRTLYRTLLFLPYAVPGFISILVFRGLFNQNFGEINLILETLFGIKPAWFSDPFLAKTMILIVNTWLGYPYIMVLCTGLIKAIPSDLYEASAIAGAGPLTNFFKITAPLIIKPLTPLLISSFAFNFNNFVLIALLTGGRPDFLNTRVPAGTTDILVSYTYRIAFQDSGQNFALAAAISTVIFLLVAALSLINLRLTKANVQEQRY
jgi:maltose/maltodextrin transport system permease protein